MTISKQVQALGAVAALAITLAACGPSGDNSGGTDLATETASAVVLTGTETSEETHQRCTRDTFW